MRSGSETKWKTRSNGCAGMSGDNTSVISNTVADPRSEWASVFDTRVANLYHRSVSDALCIPSVTEIPCLSCRSSQSLFSSYCCSEHSVEHHLRCISGIEVRFWNSPIAQGGVSCLEPISHRGESPSFALSG